MYVLPSNKRFRRRTRLENAALQIESLRHALEDVARMNVFMHRMLSQFANESHWALDESSNTLIWTGESKDPAKDVRALLELLSDPDSLRKLTSRPVKQPTVVESAPEQTFDTDMGVIEPDTPVEDPSYQPEALRGEHLHGD
jgi:hypothetical protein